MALADSDHLPARLIEHALARHTLTTLRDRETDGVAFRKGLVKLGRVCGYELVDEFGTEPVTVQTPVDEATGERITGLDDVVIVTVLRAATPFVEGLLKAFPRARQGVISAGRDEEAGRGSDGRFPVSVDYVKLPAIGPDDTVIVADPMLATGSTLCAVLDRVADAASAPPETWYVLAAVSAPEGIDRVAERHPDAELVTVAVDDRLDDRGFIVPGLGDAGDRAFGTE